MAGEVDPDAGPGLPASSGIVALCSRGTYLRERILKSIVAPIAIASRARAPVTMPAISAPESGRESLGTAPGEALDGVGAELSMMAVKDRVPAEAGAAKEGAADEVVGAAEVDADGGFVNSALATLGKMRLISGRTRAQTPSAEVV